MVYTDLETAVNPCKVYNMKLRANSFLMGLLIVVSGLPAISFAQSIASLSLANRQSVLNGRASFSFPTDAVNSARPTDIMSADHNINQETRVVLDIKKKRLVFFAQDVYAVSDKSALTNKLAETDKNNKMNSKVLVDNAEIFAILSTPTEFDSKQTAILVNRLTIKSSDNSVFIVEAYINSESYSKREEFKSLTQKVFQSIKAGNRVVKREAHVETYDIFGSNIKIKIKLPPNYIVNVDQKYDFQVFKFIRYTDFGSTGRNTFIVYFGRHPSYLFKNFDFSKGQAKELQGDFLSQKINWLLFGDNEKKIYIKEQQMPLNNADGLIVHVGMLTKNESSLAELTKIANDIELVK